MKNLNIIGREVNKVKEFIEHELDDYSFKYSLEYDEDYSGHDFYFRLELKESFPCNDVMFKYEVEGDKLYIELGEDNWYEVEYFESSVRYFWMALLWQN